jgi:hypothetical protein
MLTGGKPKRSDEATPFNVYFGDFDVSRMAAGIPFSRFQLSRLIVNCQTQMGIFHLGEHPSQEPDCCYCCCYFWEVCDASR